MKSAALTEHLENLDDQEIVELYEKPEPKVLRRFNCSANQLIAFLEERFPDVLDLEDEDEDDDEDEDED